MLSKEAKILVDSVFEDIEDYIGWSPSGSEMKAKLETRIEAFEKELVDQIEQRFIDAIKREAKA